ncbi:MAG: hypothetical protein QG574_4817 [Cyanobacteriota bacterium erpe_2018_sw_21hr_WHONDRS-SW48-000092_B_bin.40]|jgi:hypothetical protein|nr:hypothetical protein [Cyanobacteriota bacterium erpe_2018_sw_21hr_WHONDRS-SW48-000092_B_bin.40]OPZ82788.1 MAG: hypothetical protein BWY75_03260 [bacterium ADurb.Bin425]
MCQSKNNAGGQAGPSPCSACAKCKAKGVGNCAAKKLARNLAREKISAPAADKASAPVPATDE